MAEIALRNIEQGLDELEQLERIGLFEKAEIKAVVTKRKYFEYRLRRFLKTPADFLGYINYEISLYQLIQKRREKTHISYKRVEIEHAITNRIDLLFKKAEFKYPGDLRVWFSHIEFCKLVNWKTHASELFTRLLQLHPKNSWVWTQCAKFQFEDMGEADVARRTLQRGLRFLPYEKQMWISYYRLEVMYWEKLQKRQLILKLDNAEAQDAVLEGEIIVIVFRNALEKIPDVSLAVDLIKILKNVHGAEKIRDRLVEILDTEFGTSSIAWLYKARCCTKLSDCFGVFEEALTKCEDSENVWSEYIKFSLKQAGKRHDQKYIRKAIQLMNRLGIEKLSRELCLELVRLTKDLSVAEKVTERFPKDVEAWGLRLVLLAEDGKDIQPILQLAEFSCGCHADTSLLWQILIESADDTDSLRKTLEGGLLKTGKTAIFIKDRYVEMMLETSDQSQLFKKMMSLKPLSFKTYERFLNTFDGNKCMTRKTFEEALKEYGTNNEDLWLSYLRWEQHSGDPGNSGILYQRALENLENEHVSNFVGMYTLEMELDTN